MYVAAYHYIIEGYYEGYPFNTGPDFIRLDISEFIDALWELIYEHKWYAAAVELMLQSSRDHELGLRLRDILARWTSFRDASAMKILGIDPLDRDAIELFQMTLSLMRGTALLHTLSADPASIQMHLNRWKSIAKSTMLGGSEIQRFTVNNPQTSSS